MSFDGHIWHQISKSPFCRAGSVPAENEISYITFSSISPLYKYLSDQISDSSSFQRKITWWNGADYLAKRKKHKHYWQCYKFAMLRTQFLGSLCLWLCFCNLFFQRQNILFADKTLLRAAADFSKYVWVFFWQLLTSPSIDIISLNDFPLIRTVLLSIYPTLSNTGVRYVNPGLTPKLGDLTLLIKL